MKKFLVFVLSILVIAACGPEKTGNDTAKADSVAASVKDTLSAEKKLDDPMEPPTAEYTGDHVVKYENGITRIRGFFRFGKKHGTWTAFFPTGEVQSETQFNNGIRDGKITVYHPNGKIMYEGAFKNDQRSGIWKSYDETGKLQEETKY